MLSRTAPSAVRAVRIAGVRRSINPARVRFNSTNATKQSDGSALAAGMAGGAVVFGAGYAWYHMSGTAKVVSSAREVQSKMESVKKATPSPASITSFLRSVIEPQIRALPGGSSALQKFDELAETHGDEVANIVEKTYSEIWDAVEKGGDDVGSKVTQILKNRGAQLKNVGVDAGEKILAEHPELKKNLGKAFDEVKGWTDQYGPEAKKQAEEVYAEVQKIIQSGVSMESANRVWNLVQEKRVEAQEVGKKAARQAYEKGEQQAQEALKKYPEVKETLNKYKDQILGGGVSATAIPAIFKRISGLQGSGEENAKKVKEYLEDVVEEGKKKGAQYADSESFQDIVGMAEKYIRSIPGGEKFLEQSPDINKLVNIVKKKGPEAEKLATETWEEISHVLQEKYKEAESLVDESKEETKRAAKNKY